MGPVSSTRPRRRRFIIGGLILIAALVIVYLLTHRHAASSGAHHGKNGQNGPVSVGVESVRRGDIRVIFDGLGTVTPLANVTVRTQIAGQLMSLGFQEGQIVAAGDFLAQIDPRPYQVALEQAQGALQRDQALLVNARTDLARYQRLERQNSIATQQVDTQRALVEQDAGTVATDRGAVDSAKLNLTYCHITAPVAGRVGLRQVDVGNYVQTSDTNGIVVITQLQPISVLFNLPEDNIPQIATRLGSGTTLPVTALDREGATQLASGSLETIDNQVNTSTGTVALRALFANDDGKLFPNQFVNIKLEADKHTNVVEVPTAAVLTGVPGTYAYVVGDDNTVSVRPLKLGIVDGQWQEVTSGLNVGEKVVIDGTDKLKDGASVRVAAVTDAGANANASVPAADAGAPGVAYPGPDATPDATPGAHAWHHHHHHKNGGNWQGGGGSPDGGGASPPASDGGSGSGT